MATSNRSKKQRFKSKRMIKIQKEVQTSQRYRRPKATKPQMNGKKIFDSSKAANEKMPKRTYNVNDRKPMRQTPQSNFGLSNTSITNQNLSPTARSAGRSNHAVARSAGRSNHAVPRGSNQSSSPLAQTASKSNHVVARSTRKSNHVVARSTRKSNHAVQRNIVSMSKNMTRSASRMDIVLPSLEERRPTNVAPIESNKSSEDHFAKRRKKNDDMNGSKDVTSSLEDNQVTQGRQSNLGTSLFPMFGNELSGEVRGEALCMEELAESFDLQYIGNAMLVENGRIDDVRSKRKCMEPLLEEEIKAHDNNDCEEVRENLTLNNCEPKKKRRRYVEQNEDEADDDGPNPALTSQTGKVFMPSLSESVKKQCSLPDDEPIWSGIFKIGSEEYISLAGHVSTTSCEKVWKLSRSLLPVVKVTKHARSEVCPMSWASGPTHDNIDMYFFPHNMRPDKVVDQLVNEVMENDMALCAVIGEAEMLIFPSIILPEQYHTFQSKHYLWGLFMPIKGLVEEQQPHGTSTMERAMHSENHDGFEDEAEQVEATPVQGSHMDTELEDPEESERQDVDQDLTPSLARSNASHLNQRTTEATATPTFGATSSANHGQIQSSSGIPPGRMFAFVAYKTPRIEQLIQEMEHEGALVVAMQREAPWPPLGQAEATE